MLPLIALLLQPLSLPPTTPSAVKVDAFFDEWADLPVLMLDRVVSGHVDGPNDLSARVQLAWTPETLFVAVQAKDDLFQAGGLETGDRLELVFAPEGRAPLRVRIVLRDLEDPPPVVHLDGKPVKGARAAGTYRKNGWAVEASIPLRALPGLIGAEIPFAAVIHDLDRDAARPDGVLATAPVNEALVPTLPTLRLDPASGLLESFHAERGQDRVLAELRGDLTGDGLDEQVLITERDVVVLGNALPGGAGYFYFTHGWRDAPEIKRADLMELDGRPGRELFVERAEWAIVDDVRVEVAEIYGIHGGVLKRMFAQKLAEDHRREGRSLRAKLKLQPGKGARAIRVEAALAEGFNPGNYVDVDAGQMPFESVPLPWEGKGRTYGLAGDHWKRR